MGRGGESHQGGNTMSAFKQRVAKTGARALLLATVVVAALVLSGIGAGSASAACAAPTVEVKGQGSSLQNKAQIGWTGAFNGAEDCVTYTSSSSGTGMSQWGYETAVFPVGGGTAWGYIGTDDAPTEGQINNMRTAGGGKANQHLQVIPVAQAAIAIIVHPPTNCTVTRITRADLEKVFNGTLTNWSNLTEKTEHVAGACNVHIKRIVRKDDSGTSFQFKRYLAKINTKKLDCVNKTWKELSEPANNTEWPENTETCTGPTLNTIARPAAAGGGAVAQTVTDDEGTIGYVDTATAKADGNQILEVQNSEEPTFALPYIEEGAKKKANCGEAVYVVPAEARETGGSGEDVVWTNVTGSALNIVGYPICTLTWDLAWRHYEKAGYGANSKVATTVEDYLTFVLSAAGQAELESNWYAPLPNTPPNEETNVLTAAKFATGKIEE
jgi:ABC-type phosphate transport system substrate-binding protein